MDGNGVYRKKYGVCVLRKGRILEAMSDNKENSKEKSR